jgi:hypothetical protein
MSSACSTHWGEKEFVKYFGGKARRKETLGKIRRRWEYNIKLDLREIEWGGMDYIDLAQDRDQSRVLANTVINLRAP